LNVSHRTRQRSFVSRQTHISGPLFVRQDV
jgi:hypothetical protein